jgi:hypothetical protein
VRDIWRGLPTDKTVYLRWWWETIDGWIATTGQGSPKVGDD